jgi:cyclophilin family peptidyl-prolyl cis-trans isomerase
MNRLGWMIVASAVAVLPLAGAAAEQGRAAQGRGAQAPAQPAARGAQRSPGAGPVVVIDTVKGMIEFETYPNEAPKTVEHVLTLVRRNFYNGLRIHRVEPGFVIQFGDPQSRDFSKRARWGTQGSGRPVGVAEISPKRLHRLGAVAMAHAGDPARADAQMYITMAAVPRLDGKYTVFGQVISGMDVVNKLVVGDLIRRMSVKP